MNRFTGAETSRIDGVSAQRNKQPSGIPPRNQPWRDVRATFTRLLSRTLLGAVVCTGFMSGPLQAADTLLYPGDAVVSGFSGIKPPSQPTPPDANPLDYFYIDTQGPSAQILSLSGLGAAPGGQIIAPAVRHQIKASEVGQVFAITLDDGPGNGIPNIYLGATSAYGIQIVGADNNGDGLPDRLRNGQAGAQWMEGQFGPAPDGAPGTIWRVDGSNGNVTAFANLPGNSGPGVGDVVFDKRSRYFFASDLDSGLIYRIGNDGMIVDSFDHGLDGRPAKGLPAIADDGALMDIQNAAFDVENPATWGFTQEQRRVHGMALRNGRLYYAVADQVWSVGIGSDGGFLGDARWELDVRSPAGNGPITDMLFDARGRLYLAQRGIAKGSYNYAEFAEAGQSTVLRYRLEQPDDAATESVWVLDPDSYAIGLPAPHNNANGGIALGYGHDRLGDLNFASARRMLWSTGERLRSSADEEGVDLAQDADIHGLQGNSIDLVRPANEPPMQSYFADYDGFFNDPEKAGHLGDVEIRQGGGGSVRLPPIGIIPPGIVPPEYDPPGDNPGYDLNLRLTKRASPMTCIDWGNQWRCSYRIRVRNTSHVHPFFGEIRVRDHLIDLPAGSSIQVPQSPVPWSCWWVGAPDTFACRRHAFLMPHASVSFQVHAFVPKSYRPCYLTNVARITHPHGGSWRNIDPTDDADGATALIPAPHCGPNDLQTNLRIEKRAESERCFQDGDGYTCPFQITVRNTGPGIFHHQLSVQDDPDAGSTTAFGGPWNCLLNGAGYRCTYNANPLHLMPGEPRFLWAWVHMSRSQAMANNCRITNRVRIVTPAGGHPMNTFFGDDQAQAVAVIPEELCQLVLKSECPPGFNLRDGQCEPNDATPPRDCPPRTVGNYPNCRQIEVTPRECPPGTVGKWPNCRQIEVTPRKCPPGTVGKWPNCRQIEVTPRKCPPGTVGRWPNCRKIEVTPRPCPPGTVGKWPNCRRIPVTPRCPKGTVGKWPNCKEYGSTPQYCPPGTQGRYPNCTPIKQKPRKCPTGTIGKWPNCRQITLKPKVCPKGTVGKYPNCKPLILDRKPGHRVAPPVTSSSTQLKSRYTLY